MKDLQELASQCRAELASLQIPYGKVKIWSINCRAKARWGLCKKLPDGTYEIEIAKTLLQDDVSDNAVKNTIVHELLHSCPGCFKHTGRWKQYAPTWPVMFTQYVAQKYGYSVEYIPLPIANTPVPPAEPSVYGDKGVITYINASVGGWGAETGSGNMEMYVNQFVRQYGCDLFVVAYGMNNSDASAEGMAMLHQMMIEKVYNIDRDTCAVMVSTMVPNPEALGQWYGNQETFEPEMIKYAEECTVRGVPCAVAPMTSMSLAVLQSKRFCDYTGNNINHPNDFMARIYAQTLYQVVLGYT